MLKDKDFLDMAAIIANASHCNRKKVGAILVSHDKRILGTGYNGCPASTDNECEDENGITKPSVLHAELNCLLFATRENLQLTTMYITLSPCMHCAAIMKQRGVSRVVYLEEYRDTSGIEYLWLHGINAEKYDNKI